MRILVLSHYQIMCQCETELSRTDHFETLLYGLSTDLGLEDSDSCHGRPHVDLGGTF